MFAPPPNSIIDDTRAQSAGGDGRPPPRRPVRPGNGRTATWRWDMANACCRRASLPDTFSTTGPESRAAQVIDFECYVEIPDAGKCRSTRWSRALPSMRRAPFPVFRSRGTLKVGAPADLAVLELREGTFEFVDNYENKRSGPPRLFPECHGARRQAVANSRMKRPSERPARSTVIEAQTRYAGRRGAVEYFVSHHGCKKESDRVARHQL